eukprot:1132914-Pelagomonas_calceolata.AAC.5
MVGKGIDGARSLPCLPAAVSPAGLMPLRDYILGIGIGIDGVEPSLPPCLPFRTGTGGGDSFRASVGTDGLGTFLVSPSPLLACYAMERENLVRIGLPRSLYEYHCALPGVTARYCHHISRRTPGLNPGNAWVSPF